MADIRTILIVGQNTATSREESCGVRTQLVFFLGPEGQHDGGF
jgi:hypothetical protein